MRILILLLLLLVGCTHPQKPITFKDVTRPVDPWAKMDDLMDNNPIETRPNNCLISSGYLPKEPDDVDNAMSFQCLIMRHKI